MLADLVEQQTTTTGTGAYTISGVVQYRRTFAAALATGDVIPYVCVDVNGNFECGYGTWDEGPGTLARTTITASSNGGTAVNWAAGTKKIYLGAHSAAPLGAIRHKVGAQQAPTANDDITKGYDRGSLWVRIPSGYISGTAPLYICVASTQGAAQWIPVLTRDPLFFNKVYWLDGVLSDPRVNATLASTDGGGHTWHNGYAVPSGGGNAYGDGAITGLFAQTADATPKKMAYNGDHATNGGIYMEGTSTLVLTGTLVAKERVSGDSKAWKIEAVLDGAADGTVTVRAGAAPTVLYAAAGAAAWTAAVVGSTAGGYDTTIEVTGAAANDITWTATLMVANVAIY